MKTKNKKNLPPQTRGYCKLLMTMSAGVIFLLVPVLILVIDPIRIVARSKVQISQGSEFFRFLQTELETLDLYFFVFNITNADRFLAGEDHKLKVEEVGPFTYREKRLNLDMGLDSSLGVMRYTPQLWLSWRPKKSIGDPIDVNITVPSIALLSFASYASTYPFFMRQGFNLMVNRLGAKSIVNLRVSDYLWGYDDPLISVANNFFPGWIDFKTLGILDRIYDPRIKHKMEVGATDRDKFQIKLMDGQIGLQQWYQDKSGNRSNCNSFVNTYEGMAFPTDMTPETQIRFYRTILCRFLDLVYVGKPMMEYGGEALVYEIKNTTYSVNEENKCLCGRGMCIDGISDISPCFYGLPVAISNAHFTGANPKLYERVEGIRPDPIKYRSRFVIEPTVGLAVETRFTVQVNVVMRDTSYVGAAAPFTDMVVPIGYFIVKQPEFPSDAKNTLTLLNVTAPRILLGVEILFTLAGLGLLAYSARMLYWNRRYSVGRGIAVQINSEEQKQSVISRVKKITSD